jgi:hypothetical protein
MLHNYSNFEGLQAFSKAFRSASYNSSGASMYSVLDSSKKYGSIGKKVLGFCRADSVALKERKDADTYGVGLTDFYKKTAEDQIKAPDAVKQPKYTGDSGEPREGEEGESEGKSEGKSVGSSVDRAEQEEAAGIVFTVEPITAAEYQELPEEEAREMINRARMVKSMSDFDGMDIKLKPSRTKSSVDIYVPTKEIKRALIIHYEAVLKEVPEGNFKKLLQYLAGGAPFKVKAGAPAPKFELRTKPAKAPKAPKGAAPPKAAEAPPAAVGGAGGAAAPAARTPATAAITEALEGELEVAGAKKKKPIKLKTGP